MAKTLLLLHGAGGTGQSYWFPYLQSHYEALGWSVTAPDLPDSDTPTLAAWLETAQAATVLTPETVVVGHSLGCPLIMSLLERAEVQIAQAVCVAGLYDKKRFTDLAFLQERYDWENIKANCQEFVFVHSTNDPWDCDEQEADLVFTKLGGTKVVLEGQGHFGSDGFNQLYPEFPLLTKLITN